MRDFNDGLACDIFDQTVRQITLYIYRLPANGGQGPQTIFIIGTSPDRYLYLY